MIDYSSVDSPLTPEGQKIFEFYRRYMGPEEMEERHLYFTLFNIVGEAVFAAISEVAGPTEDISSCFSDRQRLLRVCEGSHNLSYYDLESDIDLLFRRIGEKAAQHLEQASHLEAYPLELLSLHQKLVVNSLDHLKTRANSNLCGLYLSVAALKYGRASHHPPGQYYDTPFCLRADKKLELNRN
jgi:hypothetical protein